MLPGVSLRRGITTACGIERASRVSLPNLRPFAAEAKRYGDGVEVGVVPPAEHAFSFVLSINLDRNI